MALGKKDAEELAESLAEIDAEKRASMNALELLAALRELVLAADPEKNLSDIPLLDALTRARAVIDEAGDAEGDARRAAALNASVCRDQIRLESEGLR